MMYVMYRGHVVLYASECLSLMEYRSPASNSVCSKCVCLCVCYTEGIHASTCKHLLLLGQNPPNRLSSSLLERGIVSF